MIRLFNVYYPVRTLVLLVGEALIVGLSFVLGTLWNVESLLRLNNALFIEGGYLRILGLTGVVLLLSHGFDLYDSSRVGPRLEQAFRILFVLGLVALVLGAIMYFFPEFLPGKNSALAGVFILAVALFSWRSVYGWLVRQPMFRERVYVVGTGDRAQRLLGGLRRQALGVEVIGWTGDIDGELTRESVGNHLVGLAKGKGVHRVIVAMADRRGTLPVEELLALRLAGVKVEEATSWLEKISGRIEVDQLYPSWLIFTEGFRFSGFHRLIRRILNFTAALTGLVITLPVLPLIALVVKLDSPGPVFYRQKRVGRGGTTFYCYKFRTMRQDAEADTGATWATDDDPRITRVGKFLRSSRLDEIPQLWCVLKGDMHFVGPRPERPEFVEWLSKEIPYYGVRHVVRPGITGWAQVSYKYGNTLEDAREKLQYDLFYIKNASVGLDMLIMFQTIKIVVLGRGAR
ncbi:MAG TPA: TIGR03013 family XrtA/PEP-CTERM system glycosyltransferase [Candidatus Sulfotelmatobacter sp.]|nr:TIGR03013 family XrtA/PEP-CTERM system glycosyltransferase [Candidatus Sulfotelmatobacter sp.]